MLLIIPDSSFFGLSSVFSKDLSDPLPVNDEILSGLA